MLTHCSYSYNGFKPRDKTNVLANHANRRPNIVTAFNV